MWVVKERLAWTSMKVMWCFSVMEDGGMEMVKFLRSEFWMMWKTWGREELKISLGQLLMTTLSFLNATQTEEWLGFKQQSIHSWALPHSQCEKSLNHKLLYLQQKMWLKRNRGENDP